MQEERVSSSAYFVTLTYDQQHVPFSPNGFPTLDKEEFPRYMKRLRKLCPDSVLKYYACGEYGTNNHRPHYHAIIFNVPDEEMLFAAWHLDGVPIGSIHVGSVTGDSVAYTMKYIDKSSYRAKHERDDRVPEFALMSKGLGKSYVSPNSIRFHKLDLSRNYIVTDAGYKIAMPRYYRDRIFDDDDKASQGVLIHNAVGLAASKNYQYYLDNIAHTGMLYSTFLDSQRLAVVNSFYSNQKLRE